MRLTQHGLDLPESLAEICRPDRMALIVYDMQLGIVSQMKKGSEITDRVARVLRAARDNGCRVSYRSSTGCLRGGS